MLRIHCLLLLMLALASMATQAADLSAAQARSEIRLLERTLLALHPGLYRYRTPAQIDAEFAAAEAAVEQGASIETMYLQASRLAAALRCGHTWTNPLNQSEAVARRLFGAADKLPLRLRRVGPRWLITASSAAEARAGDELLAVDGRSVADLTAELLPYLRADGGNDGKRLAQLESGPNGGALDRLLPLLHPPTAGRYRLRLKAAGAEREATVQATSVQQRESALAGAGQPEPGQDWQLRFDGPVAVLTLPTFAFWRAAFDWKRFLDDSFAELEQRGIRRLVLDLRRNEGGDSAVADALLAHLLQAPYTPPASHAEVSFERAPYELVRHLDTWDFGFFDHTGQVKPLDGRLFRLLSATEGGTALQPAARPYRGRTVALVGPQMSSSGFLIARDLQRSGAALLVGQPAGGNLRGMNGGQLAWLTLPRSGVAVDIPLVAWVPDAPQPDATVLPDLPVAPDFDAAARGVDLEMAAALRLLER